MKLSDRIDPPLETWDDLQHGDTVRLEGVGWAETFRYEGVDAKGKHRFRVLGSPGAGRKWNLRRLAYGSKLRIGERLLGMTTGHTGRTLKLWPVGVDNEPEGE